jgi:hypothetical protein
MELRFPLMKQNHGWVWLTGLELSIGLNESRGTRSRPYWALREDLS